MGDWVAGAVRPHLDYARRQGVTLAVAAVFGVITTLFLVLTLFLALTYVMAPVWAALLCAGLAATVVLVMLLIARHRAKLRGVQRSAVVAEAPETARVEKAAVAMMAARSVAALALPAALVGAAWLLARRKEEPRKRSLFGRRAR